jgi:hypothetical protein
VDAQRRWTVEWTGVTLLKLRRVQRLAVSNTVGVGPSELQEGVQFELAGGRPRHQDFVVDMDAERSREGERI